MIIRASSFFDRCSKLNRSQTRTSEVEKKAGFMTFMSNVGTTNSLRVSRILVSWRFFSRILSRPSAEYLGPIKVVSQGMPLSTKGSTDQESDNNVVPDKRHLTIYESAIRTCYTTFSQTQFSHPPYKTSLHLPWWNEDASSHLGLQAFRRWVHRCLFRLQRQNNLQSSRLDHLFPGQTTQQLCFQVRFIIQISSMRKKPKVERPQWTEEMGIL